MIIPRLGAQLICLFVLHFGLPTAWAAQPISLPCEVLLDPRLDLKALNQPGLVPPGPVGQLIHVGEKSARQGGRWMKDEAGIYWLVKPDNYFSDLTASNEVISSLVYPHFGIKTPQVAKVRIEGRNFAAVRSVGFGLEDSLLLWLDSPTWRAMRFPAAYLKDWDRIHIGPNNFNVGPNDYVSYDFGGTLGARATGKHKPGAVVSPAIGSYEANQTFELQYFGFRLSDPTDPERQKPLPSWHPWAQVSVADMKSALSGFKSLSDQYLADYVAAAKYPNQSDADYMLKALITNRDHFIAGLEKNIKADRLPVNAAGVVLYRRNEKNEIEVLLRKVAGGYKGYVWSFAKGRIDPLEEIEAAAHRELWEETGARAKLEAILMDATGESTTTRYFVGTASEPVALDFSGPETESIGWFSLEEARKMLNKERDFNVLDQFVIYTSNLPDVR